jgi:nitrogen regulatory protein P-II 1
MKLLKAYIHQVRTSAVVQALTDAGFRRLSLAHVKGTLPPLLEKEHDYSIDSGTLFIAEVQLELVCDDSEVGRAAAIFKEVGHRGATLSGWLYISDLLAAIPIGEFVNPVPSG